MVKYRTIKQCAVSLGAFIVVLSSPFIEYRPVEAQTQAVTESVLAHDGLGLLCNSDLYTPISIPVQKKQTVRGLRNNNPCNLVKTGATWYGQTGHDGKFMRFETPEHGLRACAVMLKNYYTRNKIDTVEKIVQRMADVRVDNIPRYTRNLARLINVKPDQKINVIEKMPDILKALVFLENGENSLYTDNMFIPYTYQQNL